MKLLLVEDNERVARFVTKGLSEAGHTVDHADNGRDGMVHAVSEPYDAIVMDRMLPGGIDGLALIETLRQQGNRVPILILSALDGVDDRIRGLRAGGDDYLTKPFAFSELQARLEALLRRVQSTAPAPVLEVGDLRLDLLSRHAERGGRTLMLQPREFRLLAFLARHVDQTVTRTMLLESVWDYRFDPQTNVIDVHISRLRNKVDKGFEQPLIHTVRGVGYCLSTQTPAP